MRDRDRDHGGNRLFCHLAAAKTPAPDVLKQTLKRLTCSANSSRGTRLSPEALRAAARGSFASEFEATLGEAFPHLVQAGDTKVFAFH